MKVYTAGKMTGRINFGFEHFDRVAKDYLARGFEVVNPADHDRSLGFEGMGMEGTPEELVAFGFDGNSAILWDLQQIADCDGVVLLRGWENSAGARVELAFAAYAKKLVQFEGEHDWRSATDVFLHHWIDN